MELRRFVPPQREVSLQVHNPVFPLEPLHPKHWDECATLLHQVFGGERDLWLRRLGHWERNPAFTKSAARGWIARNSSREIVAFMANAPFDYVADDGTKFVAMAAHTLAVRREVRGKGIGRSLTNAEFHEPCDFSVGVQTSPGGWRATLRGGGEPLNQQWISKPRLVIVDPTAFLRRLLGRRMRSLPDKPERGSLGVRPTGIEVITSFEPTDDLELGQMYARLARIRPVRDARRLNWMYFGSRQLRSTRLVLGARRDGRLIGYAGFRVLPDSIILLECRRLEGETDVTRNLLNAAQRWARRQKLSHMLVHVYSTEIREALPRTAIAAGWRRRFPYAIAIKNAAICENDLELGPWDGDAIIADEFHLFT